MPRPILESCWVQDTLSDIEDDIFTARRQLQVGVELDGLTVAPYGPDRAVVKVEWAFILYTDADDAPVDLSASLRQQYRLEAPMRAHELRDLAVRYALSDGWPVWRSWLFSTLSFAGFPPPPVPVLMPARFRRSGREAISLLDLD